MGDASGIASELLATAGPLWSSVECAVKHDRVVVYARLCSHPQRDIEGALAESERVFKSVLSRRVGGHNWLAAVQWSDRLCRTFTPEAEAEAEAEARDEAAP
jgi:hypothetical protein